MVSGSRFEPSSPQNKVGMLPRWPRHSVIERRLLYKTSRCHSPHRTTAPILLIALPISLWPVTAVPWSYVITCSTTGDVSRDRSFHKRNYKMWRVDPGSVFWARNKGVFMLKEKMCKNIKWQMTFEEAFILDLKAGHLDHHLQCLAT